MCGSILTKKSKYGLNTFKLEKLSVKKQKTSTKIDFMQKMTNIICAKKCNIILIYPLII